MEKTSYEITYYSQITGIYEFEFEQGHSVKKKNNTWKNTSKLVLDSLQDTKTHHNPYNIILKKKDYILDPSFVLNSMITLEVIINTKHGPTRTDLWCWVFPSC